MGKTFARIHLCVAGDFQGSEEKFKQWTEANGGKYSKELDAGVTHLITTKAEVRKVKAAKRMNKVKIVSSSWLEDSLVACSRRPKPEGPYLLVDTRKKGKGKKSKQRQVETKTRKSDEKTGPKKRTTRVEDVIAEMKTDGYHLYKDESNFTYHLKLARPSQTPKRKERYSMMLFESDATPRKYASFITFTSVGKSGEHFLAPPESTWELAEKKFRSFFRQKIGKKWEEREDGKVPSPKKDVHGEILPEEEGWFTYEGSAGDGDEAVPGTTTLETVVENGGDGA